MLNRFNFKGEAVQKLAGIQYLRAIAAIVVTIHHAADRTTPTFLAGEAGVDIFFIISGFIMVAITNEKTEPLRFFGDRLKRIVPLYWFATTAVLLAVLAGFLPTFELEPWHVTMSYLFMPAVSFWGEYWPLLAPGWTLDYEMFFYLLFAISLTLRSQFLQLIILSALFCLLVTAGAIAHATSPFGATYTSPLLLEFAAGAWIGYGWTHRSELFAAAYAWPLVIIAGLWLLTLKELGVNAPRLIIYGLPAAALIIGVLAMERMGGVRTWKIPLLLGNASYSIYLWHVLAIAAVMKAWKMLHLAPAMALVPCIVAGIAVGLISYLFIEKPLMTYFHRRESAKVALTA